MGGNIDEEYTHIHTDTKQAGIRYRSVRRVLTPGQIAKPRAPLTTLCIGLVLLAGSYIRISWLQGKAERLERCKLLAAPVALKKAPLMWLSTSPTSNKLLSSTAPIDNTEAAVHGITTCLK